MKGSPLTSEARTPSMNAVDNIKRWLSVKGFSQQDLADRLTKLDSTPGSDPEFTRVWHRRSINRLLNGKRRIDLDDLFSISIALDVTPVMILFPEPVEGTDSDLYRIGGMPPIGNWEMTALLAKPADVMSRPRIGVEGWDTDAPLVWVRKPSVIAEKLNDLKSAYEEAHPGVEIDKVRGGDILQWAEDEGARKDE
jgi:transcriptional regulator with XRE-family HTH domain